MTRTLWAVGLVGVLAGFAQAQTAPQVQRAEVMLREGRVLKEAWAYLELANGNYKGHRAKRWELREACLMLDKGVLKNGTGTQKAVMTADDLTAARLKFLRNTPRGVTNPQVISDLMVKRAAVILVEVRPAFVRFNQPKVLHKVDEAIKQVKLALMAN